MVFTLRWGILACGGIAETFSKDLLLDPKTRGVSDVAHIVQAVASSSSLKKAQDFADRIGDGKKHEFTAYGSYEELVKDPKVDIVYVASPHSHHYEHTLLCLRHGKHVCCEKAFTINGKQTAHLIKVAKEKKLFLMEAVWTRFFPSTIALRKLIHEDRILGRIHRVFSDVGVSFKPDPSHRLYAPELGGGAALDLGIYALTWQMMTLHQDPANKGGAPEVTGSILKTPLTGVDEFTTMTLNFPNMHAQGIATCSISVATDHECCCRIQGEKGEVVVPWPPFCPPMFKIHLHGQPVEEKKFDIPGKGMFYEADACARSIRDGNLEAELCPLVDSQLTMDILDQVRAQGKFRYPEALEATE